MWTYALAAGTVYSPHDTGVRAVAQASARAAYVVMCLALCWGILAATGWVGKLTGRKALRTSHIALATFAIVFAVIHAAAFLFLTDLDERYTPTMLALPFASGGALRWVPGILGLEILIALSVSSVLRRLFVYRRWLRLHLFAYPAVALVLVHSWFGAVVNGHLDLLWIAGLTILVPTVLLTALRFTPPRILADVGLVSD